MIWEIRVLAAERRKVLARILQVLENQTVQVHSFYGKAQDGCVRVTVVFSSEQNIGARIEAILYGLEDICSVSVRSQG